MSATITASSGAPREDTDYIKDLLLTMYYEQSEHLHSEFSQAYLRFRNDVCVWILDVCDYFHLHITTAHAAICYLDRLQPNEKFNRFEWQMLAVSCIIIAAKYNECEEHVPPLKNLGEISQLKIENSILLEYELFALKKMAWKLNVRSTSAFISSYIELGLLTKGDINLLLHQEGPSEPPQNDENMTDVAMKVAMMLRAMKVKVRKLCTQVMLDSRFKSIQCSAVASAIVFYARRCCCLFSEFGSVLPVWNEDLTKMTFHNPLKHRATMQALQLIFIIEKDSLDELHELFVSEQVFVVAASSQNCSENRENVAPSSFSLKSPDKSDIVASSSVLVSPVATGASAGKDDLSPVGMNTVFATISP